MVNGGTAVATHFLPVLLKISQSDEFQFAEIFLEVKETNFVEVNNFVVFNEMLHGQLADVNKKL